MEDKRIMENPCWQWFLTEQLNIGVSSTYNKQCIRNVQQIKLTQIQTDNKEAKGCQKKSAVQVKFITVLKLVNRLDGNLTKHHSYDCNLGQNKCLLRSKQNNRDVIVLQLEVVAHGPINQSSESDLEKSC